MTDLATRFTDLLAPERDALWRFASRSCHDRSSAEDCLQEAVMIAWRKFDDFTPGTSFRAWVFRILANTILNSNHKARRLLRQHREPEVMDAFAQLEREQAWEGVLHDPEAFLQRVPDDLRRAVKGLPAHERMVFLLRAAEDLSYRAIADLLELPMGTVMSHLFRARQRLRETLVDHARSVAGRLPAPRPRAASAPDGKTP